MPDFVESGILVCNLKLRGRGDSHKADRALRFFI